MAGVGGLKSPMCGGSQLGSGAGGYVMADRGGSWGNPRTTTPAWRKLRLTILARDGGACYKCGAPANDVDHIDGNHHNDDPANLATICRPCHARKSSAEGHAARHLKQQSARRAAEPHPGMI